MRGQVMLWRRIALIMLTNSSCKHCFFWFLIGLLNILLRCNDFTKDSETCSGSDQQQTNKQWPWPFFFFWCKSGFGKHFGTSSRSKDLAGHCWLSYKIHFSSLVTIWLREGKRLLLNHERGWDSWPLEEKNSIWHRRGGLIAQTFSIIKFYYIIK